MGKSSWLFVSCFSLLVLRFPCLSLAPLLIAWLHGHLPRGGLSKQDKKFLAYGEGKAFGISLFSFSSRHQRLLLSLTPRSENRGRRLSRPIIPSMKEDEGVIGRRGACRGESGGGIWWKRLGAHKRGSRGPWVVSLVDVNREPMVNPNYSRKSKCSFKFSMIFSHIALLCYPVKMCSLVYCMRHSSFPGRRLRGKPDLYQK